MIFKEKLNKSNTFKLFSKLYELDELKEEYLKFC